MSRQYVDWKKSKRGLLQFEQDSGDQARLELLEPQIEDLDENDVASVLLEEELLASSSDC